LDEDSLNNVRKSLLTFAETMTTFSVTMKNITQNMIPALQNFAVIAERLGEVIRNTISFDVLQGLADILTSIPSDIQKTQLYADALGLKRKDLHYEDIAEWVESFHLYSAKDVKETLSGLIFPQDSIEEYVQRIICKSHIPKREKIPVLLAHIEPLFYLAIGKTKMPHKSIKVVARDTAAEQHDMNIESFNIVITLALANAVFSNTDDYSDPIDHTMPFRNNILHNGLMEYSNRDIQKVYDVLTSIIAVLIMIINDYKAASEQSLNIGEDTYRDMYICELPLTCPLNG